MPLLLKLFTVKGSTQKKFGPNLPKQPDSAEFGTLEAPRRKNIFAICFLGSDYFVQRLNRLFDKNGLKKLLIVFMADPGAFLAISRDPLLGGF